MRGTIRVKISGLNSGKILNKLIDDGVILKNVKQKQKYVVFEIDEKQEVKLKRICKTFHRKYEIISKNNFVNLVKNLKYFVGFAVSAVLIISLVLSFNMYVYGVNISSSSDFDISSVERLLKDNNIVSGMKKNEINAKEIENLIIKTQSNVAGCVVKKKGNYLDVVIYPGVLKQERKDENIYSNYNAVITGVEIYAGQSDLKVGDVVQKGDLLIKNNNGASGKITAKIYYSDYIIYNENQFKMTKTGKVQKSKYLKVFNKNLFKLQQNCTFSEYLEENCVFCVSKNLFFPIMFVNATWEEIVYEEVVVPFESQEEKLKQELYLSVLKNNDLENVTEVTYSVVKENNLTRLDCFVECEIDIAK